MKKISLQFKITAVVGLIVTATCLCLTLGSILSAFYYYGSMAEKIEFLQNNQEGENKVLEADPSDTAPISDNAVIEVSEYNRGFSLQTLGIFFVFLVLSLFAAYWLVGKTLGPLEKLTDSIEQIREDTLTTRIEPPNCMDEVGRLTNAFNHMLTRLENAFLTQKRFAADAAHELKTPLSMIKVSLQVLELDDKPSNEDYKEFTENTKEGVNRLIATVDGLLALTDSESDYTMQSLSLLKLAEQAIKELTPKAEAHQVKLTLDGTEVYFTGNSTLFYRAVYNLVDNAIKYNRKNGSILLHVFSDEKDKAHLKVTDTGWGIPPEIQSHIFDPLYRADESRSQEIPGAGLGLSIVKLIVEKHQGTILLQSEQGKGSTFEIIL